MSTTATWRQQDGGAVGQEPLRFTIRWDEGLSGYRVTVPNLDGPLQVVPAEAYDEIKRRFLAMRQAFSAVLSASDGKLNLIAATEIERALRGLVTADKDYSGGGA